MTNVVTISPVEHELAKLMVEYGPKWGFEVPAAVEAMASAQREERGTSSESEVVVAFELDGAKYEIDLTSENAEELRSSLSEYIEAARSVAQQAKTANDAEIRQWAQTNGLKLSARGRDQAAPLRQTEDH